MVCELARNYAEVGASQSAKDKPTLLSLPISKIPDLMADFAGLCFIAGFGPAAGAFQEILRIIGQPFKLVIVAGHHHHRVADIDGMVCAEAKFTAGLEFGCDHVNRAVIHHAAFGVAGFGPRIGVKEVGKAERAIRDAAQDVQCIAHVKPDIGEALVAHMAQCGDDAVQKGFGSDKAVIRQHVRTLRHMFAAAKSDLEMEWAIIAEQIFCCDRAFGGNRNGGQQCVYKLLLGGAKFMPFDSAIEAVQLRWVAGLAGRVGRALIVISHCGGA